MRGFLNEIKNVAINRATNKLRSVVNEALGGVSGLPMNRGSVLPNHKNRFGRPNPFDGEMVMYPEDLGPESGQGHYIIFNINEQINANVAFGSKGSKVNNMRTLTNQEEYEIAAGLTKDLTDADLVKGYDKSSFLPAGQKRYGLSGVEGSNSLGQTTDSLDRLATRQLKSSIAMYMPASVSVGQSSNYREVEIGALATAAQEFLKPGMANPFDNPGQFVNDITGRAKQAYQNASNSQAMESFTEGFVRGTLGAIPGLSGIGAVQDAGRGFIRNNRMELTFDGVGRRNFSFSFKCMPKSENEAKAVDKIVQMFRFYMSPSFAGEDISKSRTMLIPATFDITYVYGSGKVNNFLNRISTSVLTSCNVTYGGERVQFFRPTTTWDGLDGAPPVETNIELNFQEIEIITRERIGVGF